jgi:hypothetical protein
VYICTIENDIMNVLLLEVDYVNAIIEFFEWEQQRCVSFFFTKLFTRITPTLCWYPSAGTDFRSLLYLSPAYAKLHPASQTESVFPDLFIFTDYFPYSSSDFLDSRLIFEDEHTKIVVESIERLPNLHTTLDNEIVDFLEIEPHLNVVVFMQLKVTSLQLGEYTVPVIYAFVENESFCSTVLLDQKATISHIIRIRYGGGCGGGGNCKGNWIYNVLPSLQSSIVITDNFNDLAPVVLDSTKTTNEVQGDEMAIKRYANLAYQGKKLKFTTIRTIESYLWSHHGDVTWNVVQYL